MRLIRSNFRVRSAMRGKQHNLNFDPSSLNLMMDDTCNSQCIMCGHDYKCEGSSETLNLKKLKIIYDHLDMSQIVEVIYGGGGEPFLNSELADIAEYTRKIIPRVQHTVISNLIHSDTTMIKRLVRAKTHFLVSVNAASSLTYRKIAGIDAFNKVLNNVQRVVGERRRLKTNVNIALSIILMRHNIDELPEFIRMAHRLGVSGVKAMYVRVYPNGYRHRKGRNESINTKDSLFFHKERSNASVKEADRLAKNLKVHFEHPPLFGSNKPPSKVCREPWKSLFINFNGDLFPCAAGEIMFMHKVSSRQYRTGNILQQPIEEIWNNPFWQELRRSNLKDCKNGAIAECHCCGCAIDWLGPDEERAHVMHWEEAENSEVKV